MFMTLIEIFTKSTNGKRARIVLNNVINITVSNVFNEKLPIEKNNGHVFIS